MFYFFRYLNTDDKTLDQFACTPAMQEKFLAIQKCFDIIGFTQEVEIISVDNFSKDGKDYSLER